MKFLESYNQKNLKETQRKIKDIALKYFSDQDFYYRYFVILHNLLFLEELYSEEVKLSNKELLSNISIPKINSKEEAIELFNELYDTHSKVRFSIETLDSIEEIRQFKLKLREIGNYKNKLDRILYEDFITKRKFDNLIKKYFR